MMTRDFKLLKRKQKAEEEEEEIENVPVNVDPDDRSSLSSMSQTSVDLSSRPPLNRREVANPRPEHGTRSKFDRTPTKPSESAFPLRTPERHVAGKGRFGWAHRNIEEASFSHLTPRSTASTTRVTGKTISEANSTQSTPTKSVVSKPTVGRGRGGGNGAAALYRDRGFPLSNGGGTGGSVVNAAQVPHFELREDPSFWMDHNIQVVIRVRPLNSIERSMHGYNRCLKQESSQSITWLGQPETRFTFDHVACESIDQETLFRMAGLPMVENCLSGYNSCIFAYGQTGSGKTYTMLGEIDNVEHKPSTDRGMTPRIFEFLFARIQAEEETRRDERLKYNCKCSFLEIYNEQITDLLDPSSSNLLLREDVKKGVYVENLLECEVHSVSDILKLLTQGSLNRKVAATNMNRESSRSHSVFTCVIESRWEKDSTTNLRFARLNLVDLAGSERQKSSGAEGERLKEAANINKSLSTLGHVIMILVDLAHGKQRHVPYRDSRLTFLLQDSLGGNSKTMIIANVSPSICCAAETLNTLKFAQRAKLIQNNAVVNEDSTGDVHVLQHQIRLLKEELSALKRQNVFRPLSFGSNAKATIQEQDNIFTANNFGMDDKEVDSMLGFESKGSFRLSTKQLKSLETTLAGALRREQMAEACIKKLEAEIEQLNRLVRQREEDTQSTKMMLRFREDKIHRMELLLAGSLASDNYLLEDNRALLEEIHLLRAKVDKNPEVTRFALENIRLLDQLRRFQELYEEGEREILLDEISNLREQLLQCLDSKSLQYSHSNLDRDSQEHFCAWKQGNPYHFEPNDVLNELEDCRRKLNSCLEENEKLRREVQHLHSTVENLKSPTHQTDCNINNTKDSMKASYSQNCLMNEDEGNLKSMNHTSAMIVAEEILDLQLEVDILKIIIKEERSARAEVEGRAFWLNRNLELVESKLLSIRKECEDATHELKEAKTVIAALESQQILAIEEMEDLRKNNSHYLKLLSQKDLEVMNLKEQMSVHEFKCQPPNNQDSEGSTLQRKLRRMQDSLDKAKRLNTWYQNDHALLVSNEEEMDKVRRQAEAETAEVIVCMQEELLSLQQQVQNFNLKEIETNKAMLLLETQLNELQEELSHLDEDNQRLHGKLQEKDMELRTSSDQWQLLTSEIEEVLSGGQYALEDASEQLSLISSSISERRIWISEKVGRLTRQICKKDLLIEELRRCLEDANTKKNDLEFMLQSLRGAALVINEAHQQECSEKEKETALLRSQLKEKVSNVVKLERRIELAEHEAAKASTCATVAFVIVNHLSEVNFHFVHELRSRDVQLSESAAISLRKEASLLDQAASLKEAEEVIQSLRLELVELKATCATLQQNLSEEEEHACSLEQILEDIEENNLTRTREKLAELNAAILSLRSCIGVEVDPDRSSPTYRTEGAYKPVGDRWTDGGEDLRTNIIKRSCGSFSDQKIMKFRCCSSDVYGKVNDFVLLNKEVEHALKNLQEVQMEITMQHAEKEQTLISRIQYQECIQSFAKQLITLQAAIGNFERQFESKMQTIDLKLLSFEQTLHEASTRWCQTNEFFELEIGDAKVYAAQKAAEASCVYAKFEEAQDTLKEADIMLNELMIANGKTMLDLERLERSESRLVKEREMLIDEIQRLQSINDLKDQHIQDFEDHYGSELMQTRDLVMELEVLVSHVQMSYEESIKSMKCDIHDLEAVILGCGELVQSWLEDIWSGIIVKDCAVSVMHLCHVGILLETVTGLNAENGLLHRGLCDSDSVIADLRKHNSKASKELQMFRTLQGKLLVDIKSGFDRILRKEEEAGELGNKLTAFEKKIIDLQLQEESMFQRANHMGSQLALLMEELHLSNSIFSESLSKQDSMLKNREEALNSQAELLVTEIQAKDVQLCIMESQLKEMDLQRAASERERRYSCSLVEKLKTELIASMVDTEMKEQLLAAEEADITLQRREVEEAHRGTEKFLSMLSECKLRLSQMVEENKDLVREIELLKDVAQSNDALSVELADSVETKARLTDQIHAIEAEKGKLREELLINSAKLEEFVCHKNVFEQECMSSRALVENLKKNLILVLVESGLQEQLLLVEADKARILQKEVQEAHRQSQVLLLRLKHSSKVGNREIDEEMGGCLSRGILPPGDAAKTSDELKVELCKLMETKERLFSRVEELEGEHEILLRDLKTKEIALMAVDQQKKQFDADISAREIVLTKLQKELDMRESELSRMSCVEEENVCLKGEVGKLKDNNILILRDLERKNVDIELSLKRNHDMEVENCRMQERILSLETAISSLQSHLEMNSHSVLVEDLCSERQHVEEDFGRVNTLEDENVTLREELESFKKSMQEALTRLALTTLKNINLLENASSKGQFLVEIFEKEGFKVVENLFHDICENDDKVSEFMKVIESLECQMKDLVSYDMNLNAELSRKDDILKGLLFDLSLLQESASIGKDQKDKVEEMMASFGALEDELLVKSAELDESVARIQVLEGQLQEKMDIISILEFNYMKEHESLTKSSAEILELGSQIEEVLGVKFSLEEELTEKRSLIEHLEMGHSQMGNDVRKMSDTIACLRGELSDLVVERDQLYIEINCMKEELEKAKALADENEAIAVEARQIAESTKIYGDEKEAEVKLLERSIEELECTINVLENKVDILKEEAERQRLHREELEMELHAVNCQMLNCADADIKRYLDAKERELEEAEKHIKYLETDMAEKDEEIDTCKAHISELILNAEAQAREYKQKFKELEAMAEQVKPEGYALPHIVNSSLNKSEKNTTKPRGSGSPFKCIGLGLAQQMKSEKDEELTAARFRIEELESQVACRQKEIFALNARLATAESMTHDVIRDLLGVKLDMTNYMSLLDNKQVHKIAEKVQLSSLESQVPEAEIMKLKQQLNEFVKERTGWLEEIDRKRAEMVSAHVALEKLRQREQLLTAEIEVLKMENANHKKKVMELEGEVEKLSGQQNFQHRIHHHAKIKEENNMLKLQNEELRAKLRRAEVMSTRVKEELGYYRASVGKSSCTEFNDEQRLMNKLKELEDDKMQIAQKLLAMCTSILKVAGITKPVSDINPAVAEEALEHIKDRITSLERELQDLMLKNRICNERIRLMELMPQASPMNSRTDENFSTPRRAQASFLSDFER